MENKTLNIDQALQREGLDIMFNIFFANVSLTLIATLTFFFGSSLPLDQRISSFTLSFIVQLIVVIALFILRFVVKRDTHKGLYLSLLVYASYIFFCIYYLNYDIAGLIIMMALLYMLATQIMTDYRIPLAFGITSIAFTFMLFFRNYTHSYTIGIGYVSTILQALALGLYASFRYVKLIKNYQNRMRDQVSQLLESEERTAMLRQSSREIMWDYNNATGIRTFLDIPVNTEGDTLCASSNIQEWVNDVHPDEAETLLRQFLAVRSGQIDYFEQEFRQISKRGEITWYAAKVVSQKNAQGSVLKIAGSYTQINDRKLKELHIEHLAYYDELTGLPNRSCFVRDFDSAISAHHLRPDARGIHSFLQATLLYIDLQNFKEFNSSFGHLMGDKLILAVANRLKSRFFDDSLYQMTSVDFGLLHYGPMDHIPHLTDSVMAIFKDPFIIDGKEVFINVMMGISHYPGTAQDADSLLRNADTALYYCQKQNQMPYMVYDLEMTDSVMHRLNLNKHMRQALEKKEFFLVYQPLIKVSGHEPTLYGFEALVRWNSPQLGFVRPDHFIPYAEETGLILDIGRLVLEQACVFLNAIRPLNPDIVISINLSAKQIGSDLFLPELLSIVEVSGANPQNISLEITETSFMESFDSAQYKLNYLREKGFKIALDDFGTGYSSLNYLGQLAIDTLKIDKSFTAKIDTASSDFYLIKSIITLAEDLNILFVAEGVETEDQLKMLKEIGCPLVQGYYFAKPLMQRDAILFLESKIVPTPF